MNVLMPRSRMISIRLSQTEYDELCQLTTVTGSRSLSGLARDAMRMLLKISKHHQFSADSIIDFQVKMDQVNRRIDELKDHLMSSERRAKQEST